MIYIKFGDDEATLLTDEENYYPKSITKVLSKNIYHISSH